jgi:hypothetical protein
VGFEKVPQSSPHSSSSSSEPIEEEEEKGKDNTPVPPVAHQGVWATVSCVSQVYTGPEDAMSSRGLVLYKLQGDVSKGDELEWKVSLLKYAVRPGI